ncbi:MAG: transposase [Bacteroidota bacterium]|nr:transposase [Bacteroidota bacterium]
MLKDRKHIRLRNYDYSSDGWYFVTICTLDRECCFGKIENQMMYPSEIGIQAELMWNEIPQHFPTAELGVFVVMPNHIHGIIGIDNIGRVVACNDLTIFIPTITPAIDRTDVACNIPTMPTPIISTMPPAKNEYMASISPKPGTLSTMLRSYKSAVTKWCNENHISNFAWQSRFHDHIIRNQEEFDRIENYILNNVANWNSDKFYTE